MNAEELYEELKEALRYFGLSFHQKDQVKVSARTDKIIFEHAGREIILRTKTSYL